jgi:methyl-accepting chemotaxis protein
LAAEQATGLNEVNTAVTQMDQVTQTNAAMVEQSTAASHTLAQEAAELARLVGQFQIGETLDHAAEKPRPRYNEAPASRRPPVTASAPKHLALVAPAKPHAEGWNEF